MKVLKYSTYSFLKLFEGSEFQQFQFGIEPMGTQGGGGQYAFAQDPRMSYNGYQDSPFTDFYARQSGLVANLNSIMKGIRTQSDLIYKDSNPFLEDINLFKNIKILRMFENNNLKLDIFLSFKYDENEYFGAFKNFNAMAKPRFESELFFEPEYQYRFNPEYKLKLGNFFYKDTMGKLYEMKSDQVLEVLGYNMSADNRPYVIIKYKGETYHVESNDYYFFKWRFEKLNEKI